jgi:hypothetical protein
MCCLAVIRYITFFVGSHTKLLITFRSALTDLLKVSSFQASPLQMWRSVANEDQKLGGPAIAGALRRVRTAFHLDAKRQKF